MANKYPYIENPVMFDRVCLDLQETFLKEFPWLDDAFGRTERITRINTNGKKINVPSVYAGANGHNNEYIELMPDANIGNFCFFVFSDPSTIEWQVKSQSTVKSPFSLIFWGDMRKIFLNTHTRDTQRLESQIMSIVNTHFSSVAGSVTLNKVWRLPENVYKGYTIDAVDALYVMHPYWGVRFDGEMTARRPCDNVIF